MSKLNRFLIIASELEEEMAPIQHFQAQLSITLREKSLDSLSELEIRGIASILHDFYNSAERCFRRITQSIDGDVPSGENWHKQLLDRMILQIDEVRPAVITKTLRSELHEYLRFRHIFRNIYGQDLNIGRFKHLIEDFEGVSTRFTDELMKFIRWLREI